MTISHPGSKLKVMKHRHGEGKDVQVFYEAWERNSQECVPLATAKRIWKLACKCREGKELSTHHSPVKVEWTPGGDGDGDYMCVRHIDRIDDKGKLFIGCISVTFREMNRIAKQLGWRE